MNEEHFTEILEFYQNTEYNPRRETLHKRVSQAYPILKDIAGDRELIAYSELANRINSDERRYLSVVLGTITRMEVKAGRPPLSAIAVQKNREIPNQEFFNLVNRFDYPIAGESNEAVFEELRDKLAEEWRDS